MPPPLIFLDMDDVLVISPEFTSYQVLMTFRSGDLDGWPELWAGLVFAEGAAGLRALHDEFRPQYVVSTSWSKYLSREQMQEIFRRTNLAFVADNLHEEWTTPKGTGSARVTEIEGWVKKHAVSGQPLLVLDDEESGWSLADSHLDQKGCVVLCTPWVGLTEERAGLARKKLRAQIW